MGWDTDFLSIVSLDSLVTSVFKYELVDSSLLASPLSTDTLEYVPKFSLQGTRLNSGKWQMTMGLVLEVCSKQGQRSQKVESYQIDVVATYSARDKTLDQSKVEGLVHRVAPAHILPYIRERIQCMSMYSAITPIAIPLFNLQKILEEHSKSLDAPAQRKTQSPDQK